MFCNFCGVQVPEDSQFCQKCGRNLNPTTTTVRSTQNPTIESPPALFISIWNPTTVSSLSIILTPVFGAYLHSKNWKVLNNTEESKQSMMWFYSSIVIMLLIVIFSTSTNATLLKWVYIGNLLSWYFVSAKNQQAFIRDKTKIRYQSLVKPILIALPILLIYLLILFGAKLQNVTSLKEIQCNSEYSKDNLTRVVENSAASSLVKFKVLDISEIKEIERTEKHLICQAVITTNASRDLQYFGFRENSDRTSIIVEINNLWTLQSR